MRKVTYIYKNGGHRTRPERQNPTPTPLKAKHIQLNTCTRILITPSRRINTFYDLTLLPIHPNNQHFHTHT